MSKTLLTRAKIEEINAKCSNGFKFDWYYFGIWKQKQLKKYIVLDDKHKLEATLCFREETIPLKRENGNIYGYDYKVIACLHLSKWQVYDDSELMQSNGLGAWHDIGNYRDKRKFSDLIELTKEYDDAKCLELARLDDSKLENPLLF